MAMDDDLDGVLALLGRTPATLATLLRGLPDELLTATEGPDTWSPLEVVAHLAHAERVNWIPRVRHVLDDKPGPLPAFDRTAHRALLAEAGTERPLDELLAIFEARRGESLAELAALGPTREDLARRALHPALGEVRLRELLATWAVHDLTHLQQITRTIAKAYASSVGPWRAYLSVLGERR